MNSKQNKLFNLILDIRIKGLLKRIKIYFAISILLFLLGLISYFLGYFLEGFILNSLTFIFLLITRTHQSSYEEVLTMKVK
jgi:cytochrome c oxidase subunit IV